MTSVLGIHNGRMGASDAGVSSAPAQAASRSLVHEEQRSSVQRIVAKPKPSEIHHGVALGVLLANRSEWTLLDNANGGFLRLRKSRLQPRRRRAFVKDDCLARRSQRPLRP